MNRKQQAVLCVALCLMVVVFGTVLGITLSGSSTYANTPSTTSASIATTPVTSTAELVDNTITLSFIGDCILGSDSGISREGNFTWYAEQKSHDYFFSEVYDVLSKDSLTIANCECVLTDSELEKSPKDYEPAYWFKAPSVNADILALGSVEVAGVVNNHVDDYGKQGYLDTVEALKTQNITVGENRVPIYFEIHGVKIGICFANLWSSYNVSYIEEALTEMQDKCDYKILFFHGGEEGVHQPDNYKITACRSLAKKGLCDLIVGSHPHVLQPMEIVNGVPIVYSLGNFCYSASNYPENKTVIFQVLLTQSEGEIYTSTRFVPCYVYTGDRNNWQPAIITNYQDINEIIAMMNTPVDYKQEEASTTLTEITQATEETISPTVVDEVPTTNAVT